MSAAVRQTGVVPSSTDCISSACSRPSCSPCSTAASTESMCCTRSHVSGSSSMYSSSTPSVYGSPDPNLWSRTLAPAPGAATLPLPVIDGGKICSIVAKYRRAERSSTDVRLSLDLDEPARVEQTGHDPGRRGACLAERVAVRAGDLVDV